MKLRRYLNEPLLEFWARCILVLAWFLVQAFIQEIIWEGIKWIGRKIDILVNTTLEAMGQKVVGAIVVLASMVAIFWIWQADFNLSDLWQIVKSWWS